jgi:hypothetical protein
VSPRAPIRADHGPSSFASYTLGDSKRSKHPSHQERVRHGVKQMSLDILIGSALPSWTSDLTERKSRLDTDSRASRLFATNGPLPVERSTRARGHELELLDENWIQRSQDCKEETRKPSSSAKSRISKSALARQLICFGEDAAPLFKCRELRVVRRRSSFFPPANHRIHSFQLVRMSERDPKSPRKWGSSCKTRPKSRG